MLVHLPTTVVSLSTLDFVLIFIYFIVLLIIGYLTHRKQKADDYLIAQRKLGTWSTMATINASKSGSILMIFVAITYLWGFSAVWYFIGVITGVAIFIPFALKLKQASKQKFYTLADYFKNKYGKTSAGFASAISIFLMFGMAVLNIIAGTKIFVFFTGWPFWVCALIMVFVISAYLYLGGFKAVAKTDIIQYAAMIIIFIILVLVMFKGSLIPATEWNFLRADLFTIIGFFIIGIMFPFASPELWQRVYSSKGKKQLRNGLWLSLGFYTIMALMLALVALTIKAQFPGIDPDLALVQGFKNLLPPGLIGLATVLLFAAIMSSLDTYIYTGASALIQDFFNWAKQKIVNNIKKVIFIFAIIGTLIAISIQNLIIGSYLFASFYTVLSLPVIATWIKSKIRARTIIISFITGILGVAIFLVISLSMGEITPTIVLVAIASSILGLLIGGIVSFIKKTQVKASSN
ncbi:sodium:solute symporter family protein [Candidatus Woesearchaeota archaeon]|nr:sodium:solute symporter family protein [Candidatus Woesearchaeota archaeon]